MDDLALVVQPDSTRIAERHTLGELRFDVRDFEGAVREWEGILRTDAQFAPALLSLAPRVDVLLRAYDPAMKRINAALQVDDRLDEAYFLKGRLYLETGDTVKAVSSFQTAAEVNPDRYDAFIQLGLLYASAHDDLALEYFRTARSLRPNSIEALYDEAIYLQEHARKDTGRYRQALTLYDRILELDGANASAAFNKGFIHLEYLADYARPSGGSTRPSPGCLYYHQAHFNRGLAIESLGLGAGRRMPTMRHSPSIRPTRRRPSPRDGSWVANRTSGHEKSRLRAGFSLGAKWNHFTWSTTALKAAGWFSARSARTLRFSSMPDL